MKIIKFGLECIEFGKKKIFIRNSSFVIERKVLGDR